MFYGAEVLPAIALVYIDNEWDIKAYEDAGNHGRYHLCLHTLLHFTSLDLLSLELLVCHFMPRLKMYFSRIRPNTQMPILLYIFFLTNNTVVLSKSSFLMELVNVGIRR